MVVALVPRWRPCVGGLPVERRETEADTPAHALRAPWQVGFFDVFEMAPNECNALPMSQAQVSPNAPVNLCVSWNRIGELSRYPLFDIG